MDRILPRPVCTPKEPIRSFTRALAAAAACLLLASIGCNGQLPPEARDLLQKANTAHDAGDNAETIRLMDDFLGRYEGLRGDAEGYYLRGAAKVALKDHAGARTDLAQAVDRAREGDVRGKALVLLGEMAFQADEMAAAENHFRDALEALGQGRPPVDRAHFRLACVLQRQGRWEEADRQFDRLIYLFDRTELARLAGRRIRCRAWAIQAGAFERKGGAETLAERLRRAGLSATVTYTLVDGRAMFLVLVGRHATYEQAAAALPSVGARQQDAFVTVTR